MVRSTKPNNVRIAGLFVLFVFGLIALSFIIKLIFVFNESNFDGKHAFNVAVLSPNTTDVIAFSPPTSSISILSIDKRLNRDSLSKILKVPIDGEVATQDEATKNNLSSVVFKSILPFGNSIKRMTIVDTIRLFIFTRGVLSNSIYYRKMSDNFNEQQKSTIISLTFIDPTIYEENKSIEVANATDTFGLGGRLASFITNIGGNVILVSSPLKQENESKIIYSGEKSYTVTRLSKVLNYPIFRTENKSISDVTIVIGKNNREENF